MRRPACTLCLRVGSQCIFPTKRKRPERYDQGNRSAKRKRPESRRGSIVQASVGTLLDDRASSPQCPERCRADDIGGTTTTDVQRADGLNGAIEDLSNWTSDSPAITSSAHGSESALTELGADEQAANTSASLVRNRPPQAVAHCDVEKRCSEFYLSEDFNLNGGFSPSVPDVFLETDLSNALFWHSSDRYSVPQIQQEVALSTRELNRSPPPRTPNLLAVETRIAQSLCGGTRQSSYALTVPATLVKDL